MTSDAFQGIAIVGAYATRQGRTLEGETSTSLTLDAVRGAVADAGIRLEDVDGFGVIHGMTYPAPSESDPRLPVHLVHDGPVWLSQSSTGGIEAVMEAAFAIKAGLCHTVLLATGQAGLHRQRAEVTPWAHPHNEFVECWGVFTAVQFALLARRHMHLYGTKPEHLAEVASAIRTHGAMNPDAVYGNRAPVSPEDVLASRLIAEPYHLLDCASTTEGGAGLVITTAERARDLPRRPVYLLGGGWEHLGPLPYSCPPVYDDVEHLGRRAASDAFRMAGIAPTDVDVLELYDPFSFDVIQQMEAFGFCEVGEGGPFVMDGRIRLGGQYPISTDGGTMAFSHPGIAQMTHKVIAAVQQLRGVAGSRQVPGASIALASNSGFVERSALLLATEPSDKVRHPAVASR